MSFPDPTPVGEDLPEPLIDVFVFGHLAGMSETIGWWQGYLRPDGGWSAVCSLGDAEIKNVTHWMDYPPDPRDPPPALRAVG